MGATRFNHFNQFVSQTVSGTNTVHSDSTNINQQHNIGLHIRFIGTMVGTLIVECSNDNVNFEPLTFIPPLTQPTGTNLSYLVDLNQVPFWYVRVSYTNSSGSGTLNSVMTSKDLS